MSETKISPHTAAREAEKILRNAAAAVPGAATSDEEGYNGWTNRDTWAVMLHMNNDEPTYSAYRSEARMIVDGLADQGATAVAVGLLRMAKSWAAGYHGVDRIESLDVNDAEIAYHLADSVAEQIEYEQD